MLSKAFALYTVVPMLAHTHTHTHTHTHIHTHPPPFIHTYSYTSLGRRREEGREKEMTL